MIDKTPKKFTPEAFEIIKELRNIKDPREITLINLMKLKQAKDEVLEDLKEQEEKMRNLVEAGEKRMFAMKSKAKKEIDEAVNKHREIMARVREVQPELKDIEFEINIAEGIFTPIEPRVIDDEEEEEEDRGEKEEETTAEKEAFLKAKEVIERLLKKGT